MKTFVRMATLCAVGASLLTACQKEDKAVNLEKEPQTVIELMEKEAGKIFFKKDLVLKDASGQNEVVLRVASEDEAELKRYLESHSFKISPVFKADALKSTNFEPQLFDANNSPLETGVRKIVISEPLKVDLQSGAVGFGIRVKINSDKLIPARNGKIQELGTEAEFVSDVWPELVRLTVYSLGGGANKVEAVVDEKNRWYNNWYMKYSWYKYYSDIVYSSPRPAGQRDFTVDGPWKVRIKVKYDPLPVYPTYNTDPGFKVEFFTNL